MRKPGPRRGAVLATAVVLAGVLAILATALFVLFQTNASSWRYRNERVRAQLDAEAGVNLAMHTLALGNSAPPGPEPFSMPGDSAQWISLPWGDRVWVVIDPSDQNGLPCRTGSVEIRSRGMSGGTTRDVSIRACPDYPSRYALLVDRGIGAGFLTDMTRINGPVHSNGPVEFSSLTPDSTDDPWVLSISTTSDGGFFFSDVGRSDDPHPEGSRVWVRPFPRLDQGLPYWDPSADSVSFDRLEAHFRGLSTEAASMGTLVMGARRALIDGDRILWASSPESPPDTLELAGRDLVFFQSGYTPLYIKSRMPLTQALTIVSSGPLYIMGPVEAQPAYSGAPFGLVSLASVVIARDPEDTGQPDWPWPWDITTNRHLSISGFVACPGGTLSAEAPSSGDYALNILGGLLEDRLGIVGTGSGGYDLVIAWDEGFTGVHPPHFPSLEMWKMFSWQQDPDYGGSDIDDNLF